MWCDVTCAALWGESVLGACQERLLKVLRERGVATNLTQMPRLLEATGEAGLEFLLNVRRGMLRGDLLKHMGGDHSLLINFRNPSQGKHGSGYPLTSFRRAGLRSVAAVFHAGLCMQTGCVR